ncbi:MAG: hypothetical protein ACTHLJ_02570 [Angustibacter sp.]
MPELPRDDHELPIDPWTLEGLLADQRPSVDAAAPPGTSALADLVSAARLPAHDSELVGEDAAVAAFVAARDSAISSTRTRHRRTSVLSTLIGSKLARAAAAGVVTLGGVSAAAFTGSLPDGAQALAHQVIGAPAADDTDAAAADSTDSTDVAETPDDDATDTATDTATETATETATATDEPTSSPSATPVGPNATGPAAFGLCTAYTAQVRAGHTPDASAPAWRNLAQAAGGEANIASYCGTVTAPGRSADHPTGSPTSNPGSTHKPTKAPATHPTGSPTSHPGATHEATDQPTDQPTDQARPTDAGTRPAR